MTRYPLAWPAGWRRTRPEARQPARFNKKTFVATDSGGWHRTDEITMADAVRRVLDSLERMGMREDDILISTNVELRLDGLPRSGPSTNTRRSPITSRRSRRPWKPCGRSNAMAAR
jgi:hypothetical protein